MRIAENVVLGLDLGNGSIGWALIEEDPDTLEKRIYSKTSPEGVVTYALGSRVIDVPENAKTKELLNVARRQKRMVRRVLARRAQRMRALRRLFFDAGLERAFDLEGFYHAKGKAQVSPWQLRAEGLTRLLTPEEFALALLHIAKHRGFRSNSKSGQKDDLEAGKVKQGLHEMAGKLREAGAETVGAYLSTLPTRRNHPNYKGEASYGMTLMRSWQEEEAALLFERQRGLGNALATESVQKRYASLAFDQRELKSVADMVGECAFIAGEKRAPAFAPTAELFRFLQKILLTSFQQVLHLLQ